MIRFFFRFRNKKFVRRKEGALKEYEEKYGKYSKSIIV